VGRQGGGEHPPLLLLAPGRPVTRIATDLGYRSTSAFIEMFKRHTGRTPSAARHDR
jgi:AraC-like DNA-binding protein